MEASAQAEALQQNLDKVKEDMKEEKERGVQLKVFMCAKSSLVFFVLIVYACECRLGKHFHFDMTNKCIYTPQTRRLKICLLS